MTTGSIKEGANDAADRCDDEIVTIADGKATDSTEDPCKNIVVLDEKYRLAVEHLWKGSTELPEDWNDMTIREQRDWTYFHIDRHIPNQPKSLRFLIAGGLIKGDCGRPKTAKPDWLDHEKFRRGQQFAEANMAAVFLAQAVFLIGLYACQNGLKPIIVTGKSSDPFSSYKRYLGVTKRLINWYTSDPWTKWTPAYGDIQIVRRMHTMIRNKLKNMSSEEIEKATKIEKTWSPTKSMLLEDFRESCPAVPSGECPYAFNRDEEWKWTEKLNQSEMAVTQATFVTFVILRPEYFGIHGASDEDLDGFCHVWRSLGYLLGVEDEFNFCNGTLQEVKQRSQDLLDHWVKPNLRDITAEWEHIGRCFAAGMQYYFPLISYEHVVLYLAELLNIRLPRLEACLSYSQRFCYKFIKIFFLWIARLPYIPAIMNGILAFTVNRAFKFSQDKLHAMKKHATITMSKGIEQTAAMY